MTLDKVKATVEIIAILIAGGWALFEYGAKARENRLQGLQLKRAALELQADESHVDRDHAWVHARLRVKNVSRREVKTFLTNWWWTYPGKDGKPVMSQIENDSTVYELAPGEESELDNTFVVSATYPAVVVHAHVFFQDGGENSYCRFVDPKLTAENVQNEHDQPRVCLTSATDTDSCIPGCPAQSAERLVTLQKGVAQ